MATAVASRRPASALLYCPNRRDRYSRHLGLLLLVTRTEYSCTTLYNRGRLVSENTRYRKAVNSGNLPCTTKEVIADFFSPSARRTPLLLRTHHSSNSLAHSSSCGLSSILSN